MEPKRDTARTFLHLFIPPRRRHKGCGCFWIGVKDSQRAIPGGCGLGLESPSASSFREVNTPAREATSRQPLPRLRCY
jgi:hypothetical protein